MSMETSGHHTKSSASRNKAKKATYTSEAHNLEGDAGFNAWGSGFKRSKRQ